MKKVCVIGSLNIDLVMKIDHQPKLGETILASEFNTFFGGGKGGNQAMALGKLEVPVQMVGVLGDQYQGQEYKDRLAENQVDTSLLEVKADEVPGLAFVSVDKNGDNLLFVYPGTNSLLNEAYIDSHWDQIIENDIFLLQFEIPHSVNRYLMKRLKEAGKTIILDPAPADRQAEDLLAYGDIITPNETELETLTGIQEIEPAMKKLKEKTSGKIIAKVGKEGAYLLDGDKSLKHFPAPSVKAVDTTAAGDSFNAGLAYGLAQGKSLDQAIRYGNGVASLAVTKMGAQSGMPSREELQTWMT